MVTTYERARAYCGHRQHEVTALREMPAARYIFDAFDWFLNLFIYVASTENPWVCSECGHAFEYRGRDRRLPIFRPRARR
jgi:hypothetical protein